MQQMSAEEFIKLLNEKNGIIEEEIEVTDYVELNPDNCKSEVIVIKNITFRKILFLNYLKGNIGFYAGKCNIYEFRVENCDFSYNIESLNIRIELCNINTFYITKSNFNNFGIGLFKCNIVSFHTYQIKSKSLNIVNEDIHTINTFDISDSNIERVKLNNILFNNSSYKSFITISQKSHINNFTIEKCTIELETKIEDSSINDFRILNTSFSDSLHFNDIKVNSLRFSDGSNLNNTYFSNLDVKYFSIQNVEFHKVLNMRYIKVSGIFHISESIFNKNFNIDSKDNFIQCLDISSSDFATKLHINSQDNESKISELIINCSPKQIGTINIKKFNIDKISIFQDNHKANIQFNNIKFNNINLSSFSNYGNLTFSSCEAIVGKESIFSIENSNLGKTQFYDFDFASFSNINIKNAVLTEIVTANVTWFLPEKLNQTEEKDAKYYKNQREVYRQLKQSTDKQGDRIQSLDFQAVEMKVYKESLQYEKKASQNDKWILWISQSNNFGLSWWKPTWILLLITFFFYIFLVASAHLEFDFNSGSIYNFFNIVFYENFAVFFQLFNPTRDLTKVLKIDNDAIGYFIHFLDISHRLLYAFFVFQIASGFRKYVK